MFKSVAILCVLALGASAHPQWNGPRAVAQAVVRPVAVQKPVAPVPVAVARSSVSSDQDASIIRFDSDVSPVSYNFNYETNNGISAESSGTLKKVDNSEVLAIQGSYRYTAPDGTPVEVIYTADETGFHPQSNLIPVAPAVPEAIARSLKYIQEHPAKEQDYVVVGSAKRF